MEKFVIEGQQPLRGEVYVSGAKNSVLPILAATLLTEERCRIKNVPDLRDVRTMLRILNELGLKTQFIDGVIQVEPGKYSGCTASYKLVSTMRASFCVLGPLLAKKKKARVSFPGGCVIGVRPVDLHLKGISALGAQVQIQGGYVVATAKELIGSHIYLGGDFGSSVLATENIMMAATLARGRTMIEQAACEPEVKDLAEFLIKMGARIKGHGSPYIEVEGVRWLQGTEHTVIPDRIEAGTWMLASAITHSRIRIKEADPAHLGALIDTMTRMGIKIQTGAGEIRVSCSKSLKPVNVTTLPYPGFPTDLQAQSMSLLSITPGVSVITEKVYPDRFIHIAELNRMGARINRQGPHAIIEGVRSLWGAPVMASDLRASAALLLAGLVAKGKTAISRIYHLDRGYERIDEKLRALGAKVYRQKE